MNIKNIVILLVLLCLSTTSAQSACNTTSVETLVPDSRYRTQANGVEVLDKKTGLIWKLCAEGLSGSQCADGGLNSYSWDAAVALADATWRLPNIKELSSLVAFECDSPAVNESVFPNSPPRWLWSSSPDRLNADKAWVVDFQTGKVESRVKDAALTQVRLVKDQ